VNARTPDSESQHGKVNLLRMVKQILGGETIIGGM